MCESKNDILNLGGLDASDAVKDFEKIPNDANDIENANQKGE